MRNSFLILMLVALIPHFAFADDGSPKPNVLFIAIDDLNDWIGCLEGHPQANTPQIDQLAQQGVLFSNAHCQAPICNPSRVSLLYGTYPSTSGIYDLNQPPQLSPALANAVSLPGHFKANGYRVIGRGKISHGPHGNAADWDDFQVTGDERTKQFRIKPISTVPGIKIRDFGPIPLAEDKFGDLMNSEWAAKQLHSDLGSDQPYFMALGIRLPHVPLYAPQRFFDRYPLEDIQLPKILENDLDDLPPAGIAVTKYMDSTPLNHQSVLATDNWHQAVRSYLACVEFVDHCLSRVFAALHARGDADNTIVVLWSDHGWHLGEKELWAKRSLWDRSTRVPLIIAGPGVTKAATCTRPVGLIDLYPTLIDLCGLPQPSHPLEGRSLTPLLEQPDHKWSYPVLTTFQQNDHTLRTESWRYIQYANGDVELYDHRRDPHEWDNLAAKPAYSSVIADFQKQLPKNNAANSPTKRKKSRK